MQLELLRADLHLLIRTTKRKVTPATFPAILEAERVQREAERLGLSLDLPDDFLAVLRVILKARAKEEEQAAKAERFPPDTLDNWRKFRVAEPAIALLGLKPATASKGREARRAEAAKSRGRAKTVTARTIKNVNHEPVILEEIALLLASDDQSPAEEVVAVTLETFRQQSPPDFDDATRGLSKQELRRLAVEYVYSYREFYDELEGLLRDIRPLSFLANELNELARFLRPFEVRELLNEDLADLDHELPDEAYFPSLHAYANRRLDNEFLMDIMIALSLGEKDTPRSRFGWLAQVLEVLHYHLIAFGPRGWALLAHAAEHAAGNFHVFLETLESTQFGRERLRIWAEDFQPQSYKPVKLSHTHYVWLTGLAAAQLLIAPRELSETERKAVVQWVFDNAADEDADQIAKLMHPARKLAWWEFDDSPNDTAFLKACIG